MTSSRRIRVAAAQLGPIQPSETREMVVARLMDMMREAHACGCTLIVYPELALTTFFPRYALPDDAVEPYFERSMPGPATQPLFDLSASLGVGFYLGFAELAEAGDGPQKGFNSSVLVNRSGKVVGLYRKVHLPGYVEPRPNYPNQHLEKRYFHVGDLGFPSWRTMGGVFGMALCNDRRWPETYRVMALRGAEMILIGYNTAAKNNYADEPQHLRMLHHKLAVQSGAYQNATWVVTAAKAGTEDGTKLIGGSCIIAPTGEIVAQAATEGEELVVGGCDLDLAAYMKRSVFDFARHRRVEHYGLIVERTAAIAPEADADAEAAV